MMPREAHRRPAARARTLPTGTGGPYWRALLEARWRARLQEVTELSLAYHSAEALAPHGGGDGQPGPRELRMLFRRAVEARRELAEVEEALGRLTAGSFGRCGQCGSVIPAGLLTVIPERRYCPRCAAGPAPAWRHAAAGKPAMTVPAWAGPGTRATAHEWRRPA